MNLLLKMLPWVLNLLLKMVPWKHTHKPTGGVKMNYELIYSLVAKIYCDVLKGEVHKLALNTDSKVDDMIVGVLDRVFGCSEAK